MNTEENSKVTKPSMRVNEEISKSYADVLKRSINDEENMNIWG